MSIPGINVMLLGTTGTGKTHALRTLLDADLEVFALFTEPHSMSVLSDTDPARFHWHYIPAAAPSWDALLNNASNINKMTYEDLSKLKAGMNKNQYSQFLEVLRGCANFTCDRTGEQFGPIDQFDTDRVFVVDSLSGLAVMAMDLVVGAKPTKAQGEWGVAMDNLERFINTLCFNTRCHFVLTAHVERIYDEAIGTMHMLPSSLGNKLSPKLPRYFNDIVNTVKAGDKFLWSTITTNMELKAQNLPLDDSIEPSFKQMIDRWKNRQYKQAEQPTPNTDNAG